MAPRIGFRVPEPPQKSSTRSRDPRKRAKRVYRGKDEEDIPCRPQDWTESSRDSPYSSIVTASYRRPSFKHVPSLIDSCIRSFASGFDRLTRDASFWEILVEDFARCPHPMLSKIWDRLLVECPQAMPLSLITKYFLHRTEVKLPGRYLPAIQNATRLFTFHFPDPELLTTLEISDAEKVTDIAVASVLFKLPNLNKIVLRNTTAVAAKTAAHIITYGPQLTSLNLSGTNIEFTMFREILFACRELRVLKLARCPKLLRTFRGKQAWTALMTEINGGLIYRANTYNEVIDYDAYAVARAGFSAEERAGQPLQKIETLKLRGGLAQSFDLSMVYNLITLCPKLRNLDISENAHLVRGYHNGRAPRMPHLEKLNLMGLTFNVHTFLDIVKATSTEIEPLPVEVDGWGMQDAHPAPVPVAAAKKEMRSSLRKLRTHFPFDGHMHAEHMKVLRTATGMEELGLRFTGEGQKRSIDVMKQFLREILAGLDDEGNIQAWPHLKSLTLSAFRAYDSSSIDIGPELWHDEEGVPRPAVNTSLERLDFGGMIMDRGLQIDDSWVPVIARFKSLRFLDASGTLLSTEGVLRIIDACTDLNTFDITGCRNINPIRSRREMFKLHKERNDALQLATHIPEDMLQTLLDEMNQPPLGVLDLTDDMDVDLPDAHEANSDVEEGYPSDQPYSEPADDPEANYSDVVEPANPIRLEVELEQPYLGDGQESTDLGPPSPLSYNSDENDGNSLTDQSSQARPRKRTRWDITPEQQAQGVVFYRDDDDEATSQSIVASAAAR